MDQGPDFIQCHRNYQIFGRLASLCVAKESPEALHKEMARQEHPPRRFPPTQIRTAWCQEREEN